MISTGGEKTIELLESQEFDTTKLMGIKEWMTIGEVSSIVKVPATAIRHWDKAGLIAPSRDPENGYRRCNSSHLRQIVFIHALKKSVYFLDIIREVVKELENNNIEIVRKAARGTLVYFDEMSKHQLRGTHSFYNLCRKLDLLG